ncbi:hypothetical protein Dda_5326 [Drechslerella dactyloides]|uniref:Uncharacterized protein n=1 Tax=Drechslerella dactyloides TaxID=74499 RepID=A0AAD6NK40_DREDA|nr:hypothetical protein Dda_5326 [Drechslerella dactyloides]
MSLAEDHEIFHEPFFRSLVVLITEIIDSLNCLEKWISERSAFLEEADEILKDIPIEVQRALESHNDESMSIEALRQHFEDTLVGITKGYNKHKQQLRDRHREILTLRRQLVVLGRRQEGKLSIVMATLPKYFWKSSDPMRQALEIGDAVKKCKRKLARQADNMKSVEGFTRVVEAGIWNCRQLLRRRTVDEADDELEGKADDRDSPLKKEEGNKQGMDRRVLAPVEFTSDHFV